MRVRWVIFAVEVAALLAVPVLIGFAFGWAAGAFLAAVFIGTFVLTWAINKRFVKPS